jgi:D-glucuronyl C5-epimerase C-terminus
VLFALVLCICLFSWEPAAEARQTTPDPSVSDPYLWFSEVHVEQWAGVDMVRGIPEVTYEGRLQQNPVTVAQWGLASYSRGSRRDLLVAADWLVRHQERDGSWVYRFDYDSPGLGVSMRSPWISGLAQGQALSVLARAWRITRDERYRAAGRAALVPLEKPVAQGGVMRKWRGHVWFEEYPVLGQPTMVLNGFLYTLIGLHDWATAAGDERARDLWTKGEESAAALIDLFDLGDGKSAYALTYLNGGPDAWAVSGVYLSAHPALAREMYRLTDRAVYRRMARAWAAAVSKESSLGLRSIEFLFIGMCAWTILLVAWVAIRRGRSRGTRA